MREDFLHYLWKYKKFDFANAKTTQGEKILLLDCGTHNFNAGPDFFNARLRIGEQLWAGNVELHIKASDWYFHQHETDPNYDNVILHVVWENDVPVSRRNKTTIPALSLKNLVNASLINEYQRLFASTSSWINCEQTFPQVDNFTLRHWQERLYLERLEGKFQLIQQLLKKSENNWEAVLFQLLSKNFGLNLNGDAFLSVAQSFGFSVLQKCGTNQLKLEALFLGQAGLLDRNINIPYFTSLKAEYRYLKHKFQLNNLGVTRPKYFRLRPDNFPNIRFSQLASLYTRHKYYFLDLMNANSVTSIYALLDAETATFWKTHYSFTKSHKEREKALPKKFKDLVIINTIIPLRFCYGKARGVDEIEFLFSVMEELASEENKIIKGFNSLRPSTAVNALQSQALLQMKRYYCEPNRCLHCAIGTKMLQGDF